MDLTVIQLVTIICMLVFEAIIITLYALIIKYGPDSDPNWDGIFDVLDTTGGASYGIFQDVHVMIFIGFGLLMTFLKKYAYSSLGFSFVIAAIVVQWDIFFDEIFYSEETPLYISLRSLMAGDFAAAATLISFGAILGQINVLQLFVVGLIETIAYSGNRYLVEHVFEARDPGGSMIIHAFGAYFGLSASFLLSFKSDNPTERHAEEGSDQHSDTFAMIGTLFLWVFWPSFNVGLASALDESRGIINTYLALTASCICAFAVSSAVSKEGKFDMTHIQNSTLAGGVCVAAVSNLDIKPVGALVLGALAGTVSVIGFRYLQGFMRKKLRIHDTCGVHNLHGIPGIMGGLASVFMAFLADEDRYGPRLVDIYPAMNPFEEDRSGFVQGAFQAIALATTLGMAICGGLLAGAIIAFAFPKIEEGDKFVDTPAWRDPETPPEE